MAGRPVFSDAGDEGGFGRPRGGEEADLDITPMIDVTFLLLIFFMVTSTMQSESDLQVPVAKHGIGVDTGGATTFVILASDGAGDPTIRLDDPKGPELTLDEVTAQVELGIQDSKFDVIIKADRDVPHGFTQDVARRVTEIEGVKFSFGVRDEGGAS